MADQRILYEGYLKAFIRGRITLERVVHEFTAAITEDAAYHGVLKTLIERYLNNGELPTAAYRTLYSELRLGSPAPVTGKPGTPPESGTDHGQGNKTAVDEETDLIDLDDGETGDTIDGGDTSGVTGDPDELATVIATPSAQAHTELDDEGATQVVSDASLTDGTKGATGATSGGAPSTWSDPGTWSADGDAVLTVGSVIKDRFELIEHIGKGGMGEVFKAIDRRKVEAQDRDPYVAIKVLNEEFKQHPKALQALQREARKTQELAHPNIMTVHDFDRQGGNVYMTMEFLDGDPLDVVLKKRKGKPFTEEAALKIIAGMCEALAYAHRRGLVHSDFKPGNVFLRKDGTVKVLDFGIAARVSRPLSEEGDDTTDKTVFDVRQFGAFTPAYASVEIIEGHEPDPRDDIYALGCVAYQLLAGKHPFNRKRATFARDNGMQVEPIPGLTRRQMRGLRRALAFDARQRTPTVEQFFDEIQRRKSPVIPIAAAAAAALLLIALLVSGPLDDYLKKQRETKLLARLASDQPGEVEAALQEISLIEDPEFKRTVIADAREAILRYYSNAVDSRVDDSRGAYDFPGAANLIAKARNLYPDSAQLQRIEDQLEARKSRLLNDLTGRFNTALDDGNLLPDQPGSAPQLLNIVRQVEPQHPLLADPRLAPAYARETQKALAAGNLELAQALVETGLKGSQDDLRLVNLRDDIANRRGELQRQQALAQIRQRLEANGPPQNLEQLAAMREDLLRLQTLQPDSNLLAQYRRAAGRVVADAVAGTIAVRAWREGEQVLNDYRDLLPGTVNTEQQQKLAEAREQFTSEVDTLFAQFQSAVDDHRLAPPASPNASALLEKLQRTAQDDPRVTQATARLAQAYLDLARRARADGAWDKADEYVSLGLALEPGEPLAGSLRKELEQIAKTRLQTGTRVAQQQQQERASQLAALYQRFETVLGDLHDGRQAADALEILDEIASLDPANERLKTGPQQIAERLAQRADSLAASGDTQGAIELVQQGLVAIPQARVLDERLRQYSTRLAQARASAEAQRLEEAKGRLTQLLGEARFDSEWQKTLTNQLQALTLQLGQDDSWLRDQRRAISQAFVEHAMASQQKQRYAEAQQLLETAQRIDRNNGKINTLLQQVAAARQAFETEASAKARAADIAGRKQTLLTQASANDVKNALATLAKLRQELPNDDPFLTREAPRAIGDAYAKLAKGFADRGAYDDAGRLIEAGLRVAPNHATLKQARDAYRELGQLENLRDELARSHLPTAKQVATLHDLLASLQKRDSRGAAQWREAFTKLFQGRIDTLSSSDASTAAQWRRIAAQLFPGAKIFTVREPAAKPPATGKTQPSGAQPPPRKKRISGRPVATSPRPCSAKLAGYGRKKQGACYDLLAEKARGPIMVVIPGDKPLAISKYEISLYDYNTYCALSKQCAKVAGDAALPLTNIPLASARAYAQWLSNRTGATYRLPTDNEWLKAAEAGGAQSNIKYNCLLKQGSATLIGGKPLPVNSGRPNAWGLVHFVGNVQEWVAEGNSTAARGGDYNDTMSRCEISLKRPHDGAADPVTGFRLVREIKG